MNRLLLVAGAAVAGFVLGNLSGVRTGRVIGVIEGSTTMAGALLKAEQNKADIEWASRLPWRRLEDAPGRRHG